MTIQDVVAGPMGLQALYLGLEATGRRRPDAQQGTAVEAAVDESLFIVAGPGTGKTTALVIRILKLVLVDGVPPGAILATTFTKKAAAELRSRILGWGFGLIDRLITSTPLTPQQRQQLASIDLNQVRTGTIDSICEQLLRDYRAPGTQPPVLADEFVTKTLMLREGLFTGRRFESSDLDDVLLAIHGSLTRQGTRNRWGYHIGRKTTLLGEIWDRRFQDQVTWDDFLAGGPSSEAAGRTVLGDALEGYEAALRTRFMVDFTLLEQEVLERLRSGQLQDFANELRVLLVDEYQDTNLLQESLYFELARASGAALNVVGDDDQSLYRFRGATVELFSQFATRYATQLGRTATTIFLSTNYRSTQAIVDLVNSYATLDRSYQGVRVASKPILTPGPAAPAGMPILGMFRATTDDLARDLAGLIEAVFRGSGFRLPDGSVLVRDVADGDVGDCALLCSSPKEWRENGTPRLPGLLRQELATLPLPIPVFNPRGEDFTAIEVVSWLGGVLLECLDPDEIVETATRGLPPAGQRVFQSWRTLARAYLSSDGARPGLQEYVTGWGRRDPGRSGALWPLRVSALDLLYGLVYFFPELYDDPEGQVYLEVFARQLSACQQIGKFKGRVVWNPSNRDLSDASVKELLRDFLGPIASGVIGVDEELLEAFPRDRLNVLSIHQAKGLEFPLTIVDVGSDFRTRQAAKFRRFPDDGSPAQRMEDWLRPYTGLGTPTRSQVDRAFDDLYRLYFVGFSRPQDVLLLVGLEPTLPGGTVENVATGMDRTGVWRWQSPVPFTRI